MKHSLVLRPAILGSTNYGNLFPGLLTRIDDNFKKFIESGNLGTNFNDGEREYYLFQTDKTSCSDTAIINEFKVNKLITPSELLANITYLNGEGRKLLDIPEGEIEVNFILGYIKDEQTGVQQVMFVEHEFKVKDGREEIHFHIRPLNQWQIENPKGFAKKSK